MKTTFRIGKQTVQSLVKNYDGIRQARGIENGNLVFAEGILIALDLVEKGFDLKDLRKGIAETTFGDHSAQGLAGYPTILPLVK